MSGVAIAAVVVILAGLGGAVFGIYAMFRGGREEPEDGGGLGPIPERGIHFLAGVRILVFGVLCVAFGIYGLFYLSG